MAEGTTPQSVQADRRAGVDGRSPVRAAVLAVLLEAPGHGWDVATRVNRRMGASWRLQSRHIYPVLKRLEADGLVVCERESLPAAPYLRDVYRPTERARHARSEWLSTPPASDIVRTDLQTRLAFATEAEIPQLLRALTERRLDILEEIEDNAASEPPRVSWLATRISLQRSAVDRRLKAEMEWVDEACRELEAVLVSEPRR